MDEEIDIKQEHVWLEESDPYVSNTVDDDHVVKIEPQTSITPKVENETLDPVTEDGTAMLSANVKDEILVEEPIVGQLVPCFKEEDQVETSGSEQFREECYRTTKEKSHVGMKSYCCEVCKRKFLLRRNLDKHMSTHSAYACHLCSTAFMKKSYLNDHLQTHTQDRPFSCNLCNRKFSLATTFKRHMMAHNGERPFSCDLCDRKYSRGTDLQKHMKRHTGES